MSEAKTKSYIYASRRNGGEVMSMQLAKVPCDALQEARKKKNVKAIVIVLTVLVEVF
jgi:hypothetical protein